MSVDAQQLAEFVGGETADLDHLYQPVIDDLQQLLDEHPSAWEGCQYERQQAAAAAPTPPKEPQMEVDIYEMFERARVLFAPVEYAGLVTNSESGPALVKMVTASASDLHSYGLGLLIVKVYIRNVGGSGPGAFQPQVHISTIDDGGAHGWGPTYPTLDEAFNPTQDIIAYFRQMNELPTLEELNLDLRPFGIYMIPE